MLEPLPIDFNEAAHRYQWQPTGEWLAHSVTQIKGASMADSQRAALDRTKHIWEPRGKTVHSALEAHLLGLGPVGLEPVGLGPVGLGLEYGEWIKPLLNHPFWDQVDPVAVEYRLCDLANSIGGSCDCLLLEKSSGRYLLCDLKTQSSLKAGCYSTDCQMGGYLSMFCQHHPAIEISECITIWSRPGKTFVTRAKPDKCLETWGACLADFQANHLEVF